MSNSSHGRSCSPPSHWQIGPCRMRCLPCLASAARRPAAPLPVSSLVLSPPPPLVRCRRRRPSLPTYPLPSSITYLLVPLPSIVRHCDNVSQRLDVYFTHTLLAHTTRDRRYLCCLAPCSAHTAPASTPTHPPTSPQPPPPPPPTRLVLFKSTHHTHPTHTHSTTTTTTMPPPPPAPPVFYSFPDNQKLVGTLSYGVAGIAGVALSPLSLSLCRASARTDPRKSPPPPFGYAADTSRAQTRSPTL